MTTVTMQVADRFPPGSQVTAYRGWDEAGQPVETATVGGSGWLTFTTLVEGPHTAKFGDRRLRFYVTEAVSTGAGATGAAGPAGPEGPAGPAGPKGDPGAAGAAGAQGAKGDVGAQGVKGDPGAAGQTGAQGPQGLKGDTGSTGPAGSTGSAGPQGLQGVKGDTGLQGATGQQGIQGIQGPAGAAFVPVKGTIGAAVGAAATTYSKTYQDQQTALLNQIRAVLVANGFNL